MTDSILLVLIILTQLAIIILLYYLFKLSQTHEEQSNGQTDRVYKLVSDILDRLEMEDSLPERETYDPEISDPYYDPHTGKYSRNADNHRYKFRKEPFDVNDLRE